MVGASVILEDFVMLGTTVPEPNSRDRRIFVCSAGVSEEYRKLIRLYPLARRRVPERWGMYRIQIERNPNDSRDESFQVYGDRTGPAHQWINYRFEERVKRCSEHSRAGLLRRHAVGSIKEANARRLSLAILHPHQLELNFQENPASAASPELTLFDTCDESPQTAAQRFQWMPRISFRDDDGRNNLMLRDWGAFELQRKNTERYFLDNLEGALHLTNQSSLLVGNMNNQRNAWLVISVLNGIREAPTLFDL
jgi:hypothetical protein